MKTKAKNVVFLSGPTVVDWRQIESDKQYEKAKEILDAIHKAGYTDFYISRSITDFGVSTYIQGMYNLKFRISDHSVTSTHRILSEYFFNYNTPISYFLDVIKYAEQYAKELSKKWDERAKNLKRLDEKWERIKNDFTGLGFKVVDRTYQTVDTFFKNKPASFVFIQELGKNRFGEMAYSYEWACPIDDYTRKRPSNEWLEHYDEHNKKLNGLDELELLELEAEALALILQLEENKGKEEKSSSNSTPKYKVGDVFFASNNDRYWKITSVLTSNEDITYFVDEYRKGKSKTYHTDQQSFSESELENKMLAQGAVLQKDKENKNSYPERNGEITADVLKKTFDFRYVNVDINLDEKQEQDMLDVSYDTFRQLAMLLNIPMNAIGLGRNLTLNIGLMRMDLTTGACYSPQYRALNFKGLDSFKHIAHEWFHAFDHYLNYAHDNMNAKGLFSEDCYNETTHYGKPAQDNIAAVIKAIDDTPYYSRSAGVAKASRYGKYWTSNCELLARAFEVYVKCLMEKHDINNSHLVSLFPNNPYPNYSDPKDMPIQDAFKVLFDSLTMRKTIYGDEALYGN